MTNRMDRPHDRGHIQPQSQQVWQEGRYVTEVHLQRREDAREATAEQRHRREEVHGTELMPRPHCWVLVLLSRTGDLERDGVYHEEDRHGRQEAEEGGA